MVYLRALLGITAFCLFASLLSDQKRKFPYRVVLGGIITQILLAFFILHTATGQAFFDATANLVIKLMSMTEAGTDIVFGPFSKPDSPVGFVFAFSGRGLPAIIFFSALVSILYYLGIMQTVIWLLARVFTFLLGVSGAEAMCMAANIFVGQTEAALTVRYYLPSMTRSELNSVMTGGFATMAAGMIAIYIGVLGHHNAYGRHILAAEVMSAPAAFVIAKLMRPETQNPETSKSMPLKINREAHNLVEAAANGTRDGLTLWLNVVAMLIAFSALLALFDWILGSTIPGWTLARIAGYALSPIAWLIGVDNWHDCRLVGSVLGTKIATNEFVGYLTLAKLLPPDPAATAASAPSLLDSLSPRSAILAAYAIADFANFVSIGIQLGGMTPLAPSRKIDFARLATRAMLAGCLASYMTATIAALFV